LDRFQKGLSILVLQVLFQNYDQVIVAVTQNSLPPEVIHEDGGNQQAVKTADSPLQALNSRFDSGEAFSNSGSVFEPLFKAQYFFVYLFRRHLKYYSACKSDTPRAKAVGILVLTSSTYAEFAYQVKGCAIQPVQSSGIAHYRRPFAWLNRTHKTRRTSPGFQGYWFVHYFEVRLKAAFFPINKLVDCFPNQVGTGPIVAVLVDGQPFKGLNLILEKPHTGQPFFATVG
jgi:hypothetical protein